MDTIGDVMPWQRVIPPLWWPAAARNVVADRRLPDGTRQHMVAGSVPANTVIANAQVIGEDDCPDVTFDTRLSHLSFSAHEPRD